MSIETLQLDQLVDPFEARVVYSRDASGTVVDARFDLSTLPRLEPMLVGKPVDQVPDIVKRLCGLCPVAHHLAGIAALESLYGITDIPPAAQAVRALLLHGTIIDAAALKFIDVDRDLAIRLRTLGRAVLSAAGAQGHFPDVAIPGGVRPLTAAPEPIPELPELIDALRSLELPPATEDDFSGLDLATCQADGTLDPIGGYIRAADAVFPVSAWHGYISETVPGQAACRPVVRLAEPQPYRVGPMAHARLLGKSYSALGARRASALASMNAVADLVAESSVFNGPWSKGGDGVRGTLRAGTGIGVVDGPRGLLMHTYRADADGTLTSCEILTPTAQNEWWLADMLRARLAQSSDAEQAIRAADPCLPISSAPKGTMALKLEEQ